MFIQQTDNSQRQEYFAVKMDEKGNLVVKNSDDEEKIIFSGDLSI